MNRWATVAMLRLHWRSKKNCEGRPLVNRWATVAMLRLHCQKNCEGRPLVNMSGYCEEDNSCRTHAQCLLTDGGTRSQDWIMPFLALSREKVPKGIRPQCPIATGGSVLLMDVKVVKAKTGQSV
jgi:hypothetical protein